MEVSSKRIKIFKIRNRKGYADICLNHLTEGKTIFEAYDRLIKALRRSKIKAKGNLSNLKALVVSV